MSNLPQTNNLKKKIESYNIESVGEMKKNLP